MAQEHLSCREKFFASVADFFEKEKESGQPIDFKNISSQTAKACKISVSSVLCCQQWAAKPHRTSKKARTKAGWPKVNRRIYCQCSSPCCSVFFRVSRQPTLNKMLPKCQEENVEFPDIGRTSLWKQIKSTGFRYCKTRGNREIMMENLKIRHGDIVIYVEFESFQPSVVLLFFLMKHV